LTWVRLHMGTTWRLCCRLDLSMRTTWLGYELTWYELTCNQPTTSPLPTTTWRHVQWCGVGRNSTTSQRPTMPSACPYRFCKSTKLLRPPQIRNIRRPWCAAILTYETSQLTRKYVFLPWNTTI